jgi:K+ transporter
MTDRTTEVSRRHAGSAALMFGALGVVFGDIGTSPLYALSAAMSYRCDRCSRERTFLTPLKQRDALDVKEVSALLCSG